MHKAPRPLLKNDRGVALLIALFAMTLLIALALNVAYETQVEYAVSNNQISELKASYAAKSGAELSLFRILIYKKIMATYGDQIEKNPILKSYVDQLWQMPFVWPPILPEELNSIDRDQILTAAKESFMDVPYNTNISGEGGKTDLNDLGSPIPALSDRARAALLQIFNNEIENNKDFKEKYDGFRFDELVNNIADWVDVDDQGRNGGSELNEYEQPRESDVKLPPNRPFRTLKELHMVAEMKDDFYNLLAPQVTVFGTMGINPNVANEIELKSLDKQINDDVVSKIIERRNSVEKGGPFADDKDFFTFLESLRVRTDDLRNLNFPFYYDAEYNFRITSSGIANGVRKEITVITYDIDNLTTRYSELIAKLTPTPGGNGGAPTPTPAGGGASPTPAPTGTKYKVPKGRPNVVQWLEN